MDETTANRNHFFRSIYYIVNQLYFTTVITNFCDLLYKTFLFLPDK